LFNLYKSLSRREKLLLLGLIIFLVLLDQLVKLAISGNLMLNYGYIEILPILELRYIINSGVSFSFLSGLDYRLIAFISFFACTLALYLIADFYKSKSLELIIAVSLLLAGSIGNLIDRLVYKGVIDYIHVYYQSYSFPIFNLADCFITFCSIIIIKNVIISWRSKKSK
jgi:signal peptidase II